MTSELRLLGPGDEAELFAFLELHLESSLFLIGNAERAGLRYTGELYQATYVAHYGASGISAVAAHSWNGIVLVQGDEGLEQAVRYAVAQSRRRVQGIVGPLELTRRTRAALAADDWPTLTDKADRLYSLELARLNVPELLNRSGIVCRRPTDDEIDHPLTEWRVEYFIENLGYPRSSERTEQSRNDLRNLQRDGRAWVLLDREQLVAFSGINTRTRGIAQVGGVWTPPELRSRGYGRAVVAGSLLAEREMGTQRTVLFTANSNVAAQRAYRSLGYEPFGDFGLVLFQ